MERTITYAIERMQPPTNDWAVFELDPDGVSCYFYAVYCFALAHCTVRTMKDNQLKTEGYDKILPLISNGCELIVPGQKTPLMQPQAIPKLIIRLCHRSEVLEVMRGYRKVWNENSLFKWLEMR